MKKLLVLPVMAIALIALSACSNEAERSAAPVESSSPGQEATPAGGFFIDGTRLCVYNGTTKMMTAKARNPQEESKSSQLSPGTTYCAAGYVESSPGRESGDIVIDVRATTNSGASTDLILVGDNQSGEAGVEARALDGPLPRHVIVGKPIGVGDVISGPSMDGKFTVTMERVSDCCGWKQLRADISEIAR